MLYMQCEMERYTENLLQRPILPSKAITPATQPPAILNTVLEPCCLENLRLILSVLRLCPSISIVNMAMPSFCFLLFICCCGCVCVMVVLSSMECRGLLRPKKDVVMEDVKCEIKGRDMRLYCREPPPL